ncbi:hypothetical protein TSOC_014524, partial [Tetrabaena socialis]
MPHAQSFMKLAGPSVGMYWQHRPHRSRLALPVKGSTQVLRRLPRLASLNLAETLVGDAGLEALALQPGGQAQAQALGSRVSAGGGAAAAPTASAFAQSRSLSHGGSAAAAAAAAPPLAGLAATLTCLNLTYTKAR